MDEPSSSSSSWLPATTGFFPISDETQEKFPPFFMGLKTTRYLKERQLAEFKKSGEKPLCVDYLSDRAKSYIEGMSNPKARNVKVRLDDISLVEAFVFSHALKMSPFVERMTVVGRCEPSDDDVDIAALADGLVRNESLEDINLEFYVINDREALMLAEALTFRYKPLHLNLQSTAMGDEGAVALAEALSKTSHRVTLGQCSRIGDAGLAALFKVKSKVDHFYWPRSIADIFRENYILLAEALIESGHDFSRPFLEIAAESGNVQMVELALRLIPCTQEDKKSAMLYAAAGSHIECFEFLARR